MAALIDTNVLIYAFDPRTPWKQATAKRILRDGLADEDLLLPHQAVVEFVAATIRPRKELDGRPLLSREEACREAEGLTSEFTILYPDEAVLRTALRGAIAYQLSWFDAHVWAYAEVNGLDEILSENFEHGRRYGTVRARDPFLVASGEVRELPPLYES